MDASFNKAIQTPNRHKTLVNIEFVYVPPEKLKQRTGHSLTSWGNQAAFVKVCPIIWTQVLMSHPQLDSSMSLTFSPEWLTTHFHELPLKQRRSVP
jgi:hypothetical protein